MLYYMNSFNQTGNNSHYLVDGNTKEDLKKLKAHKIANGTFYSGPFSTPRGNPDFGYVPFLGEYIFLIFSLYFLASNNYRFATYAILCYIVGSILNGIRFYYVNTLTISGDDIKFIKEIVNHNIIGATIASLTLLYIYFKNK